MSESGGASRSKEKDEWIVRALGVQMPSNGSGPFQTLAEAAQAWRDASETVDGQIGALQNVLRASGDEELREIGEYGLNAVTGNFKVRLMAALLGAESGNAEDRKKLSAIVTGLRQHLASDERVEACDENPFGVAVSIRTTLIPALDRLERSVAD